MPRIRKTVSSTYIKKTQPGRPPLMPLPDPPEMRERKRKYSQAAKIRIQRKGET